MFANFVEGDFEEYLFKLQDPQQWVGEVEISALAVMYKRDFEIFQEPGKPAVNITDNNFKDKVRLCFLNGNHYDSVYPISHIKSAALCQSILYELLYEGVFKVDRSSLVVCNRNSRPNDLLSDDIMGVCGSSDESDSDTREPLWVENGTSSASSRPTSFRGRGRGRLLPERVRRSLNPTLLRNVEYDIWHKSKRAQQKIDYSIAAGMQFSVGDRCQVRLESNGRSYNATIKEVPSNSGPVTVFIEELGKKQVPLWSIRPHSEENSWSTVVHRDKRLSNGHGDWEERGKGRGRGKATSASPSVSQTTAAGSSGRVQKQHSWPPQATVEEQGGGKTSRKSMTTIEAAFGPMKKERTAEEEKEENLLLLEIQLRDEHSFPALGTQADGGRRRGGEKKRLQRNKTKSPVEDVSVSSPPAGERPMSSTPPPVDPDSAGRSSFHTNITSAVLGSTHTIPPTTAAPATKTSAHSYASAAAPSSPPANIKPSFPSSTLLLSFLTPVLPAASSPLAPPSSSPPRSAATPPPSSSAPQPTFIAPIAPSPTAAQGFLRSFSPVTSQPRSPTLPSSSALPPPPQVKEAPPAPTANVLPQTEGNQMTSQTSQSEPSVSGVHRTEAPNLNLVSVSEVGKPTQPHLPELQTQSRASLPLNQVLTPQNQPETHTEVSSELLPEVVQIQSPHPPPGPSQIPPSPSLHSEAKTPPPPPQKPESPPPSYQQPQPPYPSLTPQQHHLPHPQPFPGPVTLHQLTQVYQDPLYPGFPQGEKGEVAQIPPLSTNKVGDDLPKDLNILRFFFNLGVKAYTMPIVSPYLYLLPLQQIYTMQPTPPSPLHPASSPPTKPPEAHPPTQYPPPSVSPQYDHHTPAAEPPLPAEPPRPTELPRPAEPPRPTEPPRPAELPRPAEPPYPTEPPYPAEPPYPTELLHPAELPRPTEPTFNLAHYQGVTQPPPHRMPCPAMPWQQMPPPRNPNYPVEYPSPPPPYSAPPPSSQGYHPGHGPVHSLYPSAGHQYPPFSLGYQPSPTPEELQVNQGAMEQLQPTNGDSMLGHGHVRVLGPLESPAAANNNRTIIVSPNFAFDRKYSPSVMKEVGESLTRTVLLVDPPLNNNPILAVVSDSDVKDVSVSKATMKPGSIPSSPSAYRGPRKQHHPNKTYIPPGAPDPSHLGYQATSAMGEPLSVACSTEDDFEGEAYPTNYSGRRINRGRGGRGRGGHDAGRGPPRRRYENMGAGFNFVQYNSSLRGRGRERGY